MIDWANPAREPVLVGGYDPQRPNHFYADSLGDPATCTGDHNHDSDAVPA